MVMLKSFQRLGYFTYPELVPIPIIRHLRKCLNFDSGVSAIPSKRSRSYYQDAIRTYLRVSSYDKKAQKLAAIALAGAAQIQDHPADLINVAIEELVKERYELPAFSSLDRLVGHIRTLTNRRLFKRVIHRLSEQQKTDLDSLLVPDAPDNPTNLNLLKSSPKSAKLTHIKELQRKFNQLMELPDAKRVLSIIATTKVTSFAAQARAMDISEFQDLKLPKRRTLLLCLLYQAQVKTRDHLVEIFLKRIGKIHNNAKKRLVELREKHLAQTESLLGVFTQVLEASSETEDYAQLGKQVQSVLKNYGGTEILLQQCSEIAAYNSKNHLPLVWPFYSPYRQRLFELVRSLEIQSTSSDQSVMEAVAFVLDNQHRRSKWLKSELDLSFISDSWRKLVLITQEQGEVLERRQLEICIFSYLATELKTGDACVIGSENYADFREQLLSWDECETRLEQYCQDNGLPNTANGLVIHLKAQLRKVATEVDQICQKGDQVTISADGVPVLKRIPAQKKLSGADILEAAILEKLPERSLMDILCNVEHWLNWTRHFGPLSGSEPKLSQTQERYILTTFGYGCNLGPNQFAMVVTEELLTITLVIPILLCSTISLTAGFGKPFIFLMAYSRIGQIFSPILSMLILRDNQLLYLLCLIC